MNRFIIPILFVMLLCFSCKEDDDPDGVPNVPVQIELFLNLPQYLPLQTPGNWAYITGGSRGIIVYCAGPDDYVALDRHCPYQPSNGDRVHVLENNIIASDTLVCGSKFVITDGSVSEGPSSLPLRQYQTTYNGASKVLTIFN